MADADKTWILSDLLQPEMAVEAISGNKPIGTVIVHKSHLSPSVNLQTIQNLQPPTPPSHFNLIEFPHNELRPALPSFSNHDYPNLKQTQQIHAHFIKTQFERTLQLPLQSFQLPLSCAAQHNFLITSYTKNSCPDHALKLYVQMRRIDVEVDNFTVPSVLKACGEICWIFLGRETHGFAVKNGFGNDLFVGNALIQMYDGCGDMDSACFLFDKMPQRDVVTWSTMIGCFTRRGLVDEALKLIREMHLLEVKISEIAMINMVSAIASRSDKKMGRAAHGYLRRIMKYENPGILFSTSLTDMYIKCGDLTSAEKVFHGLASKNIVSWTVMIAGYIRFNSLTKGAKLFVEMLERQTFPTEITMLCLIKESALVKSSEFGRWLHVYILRNGFHLSLPLATALVDMYGKCGEVKYARRVFDSAGRKDVIILTSMISAYSRAGCVDQAFDLFIEMLANRIEPTKVTLASLLSLCSETGALELGKWIHTFIIHHNVELDNVLTTALIEMYAKCGEIDGAKLLFHQAIHRDVTMWNTMMAGFAIHGYGMEAIELFEEMQRENVEPNDVTFIELLHACSHAGLVAEGKIHFEKMVDCFRLVPKIEIYGCMVDLLGRAGHIDEAYQVIEHMPMQPNKIIWSAFLAACKLHKNLKMGEMAAGKILELEPLNCGYNVLVSNIYAEGKRWKDVSDVRKRMKKLNMKKEAGLSFVEINGSVHQFKMGDNTHPLTEKVYEMLGEMRKKLSENGYVPNTSVVLRNMDEEEKESSVNVHSEKLAMALGLIGTPAGTPVRIVKNLRVCDDCHAATKLLSNIYRRRIIVRDRSRFHHFVEGSCSCNDFW